MSWVLNNVLKLIFITYKDSVKTSRRTQIFHLKIYWCVLCKEPIAVHGANHKNKLAITNSVGATVFWCWTWRYTHMQIYLKSFGSFQDWVPDAKTAEIFYICVFPQTSSSRNYDPTMCWHRSFRCFICADTYKDPGVCSSNWKWRDTSPKHFLCLSNHSQMLL